jgi:hypothetical protein
MNTIVVIVLGLLLAAQSPPTGKVDSAFDKKANFAALRTYSWTLGSHAFNPEAHKIIVAALEAEMAGLGFTKAASGADVTLAYYTTTVSNVDFKALDKAEQEGSTGAVATRELGKLVVVMRRAQARDQIWSAATREYIERDVAKLGAAIRVVAARLFDTYPGLKRSPTP